MSKSGRVYGAVLDQLLSLWRRELVNWKKCALHVVADAQGKRRGSLCSSMPPRIAIKTVDLIDRDNPEILRVKN